MNPIGVGFLSNQSRNVSHPIAVQMPDENPTDASAQPGDEMAQESFRAALVADLRERFSTELTAKESVSTAQITALLELIESGSITASDVLKTLRESSATTPAADE